MGAPDVVLRRFEPHTVKLITWARRRGALSIALAPSVAEVEAEGRGRRPRKKA